MPALRQISATGIPSAPCLRMNPFWASEEAGKLFANFVKPHDQGGLCGMKFTPEQTFVVGETLNIQWKAEADFLAEPYKGSDAYETHDGLMAGMVSTFKGADLKMKK
jgi:hypothetical protein